ncbi:hypothetical protein [Haliangium sp.]|uniref:hypothetical protein n=1 Tax=Haliangium sp. TaxID=2663208 RepID=UPI003D11C670
MRDGTTRCERNPDFHIDDGQSWLWLREPTEPAEAAPAALTEPIPIPTASSSSFSST